MSDAPIQVEGLCHYYGSGRRRKQILFDLELQIRSGEIVILTGPSGSGKTTALTLMGALRSAQEGSLRVLGSELTGARRRTLMKVRSQIGYIFQHHNLIDALSATQNVQMSMELHRDVPRRERRKRSVEMLEAVGLGDHVDKHVDALSGGQKQRVAIARALVSGPRIILADEPTASLDKQSGREVVTLMQSLARKNGVTVILVTHDNRILDVADRIVHLEDGRLTSFGQAVMDNTRQLMSQLAESNHKGVLARQVREMKPEAFVELLESVTHEAENFLRVTELASNLAFESMLDELLEAFARKVGDLLEADRSSLFLLDEARGELWSKAARDGGGAPVTIRIPRDAGIVGAVVATGKSVNQADAYDDPRFNRDVDRQTGYRTRSLLCVPLADHRGRIFGAAQVLNKRDGTPFGAADEARFREFMASVGVVLVSWWKMSREHHSSTPAEAD